MGKRNKNNTSNTCNRKYNGAHPYVAKPSPKLDWKALVQHDKNPQVWDWNEQWRKSWKDCNRYCGILGEEGAAWAAVCTHYPKDVLLLMGVYRSMVLVYQNRFIESQRQMPSLSTRIMGHPDEDFNGWRGKLPQAQTMDPSPDVWSNPFYGSLLGANQHDALTLLLRHIPKLPVTELLRQVVFRFEIESPQAAIILIKAGANAESSTFHGQPIHLACRTGSTELARLIISKGVRLDERTNHRDRTALSFALEGGHHEIVKLMLDAGAGFDAEPWPWEGDSDTDDEGDPDIHRAVRGGSAECVRHLLEAGASATVANLDYQQPLHAATTAAMVSLLVAAGADVNAQGPGHVTPLQGFCGNTRLAAASPASIASCFRAFLAAGATVDLPGVQRDRMNNVDLFT